jgi:hypothetical protein
LIATEVLQPIFQATTYITWTETVSALTAAIARFLKTTTGPVYLVMDKTRFSSEWLFAVIVWDKIKTRVAEVVTEYNQVPLDGLVLLIDDFSLTGTSLVGRVDDHQFDNKTHAKTLRIYACVAAITQEAIELMQHFEITPLYGSMLPNEISVPADVASALDLQGDSRHTVSSVMIPFYSDHKIPNIMMCAPRLYHYGKYADVEHGCLIGTPPDEMIKHRMWESYFKDVVGKPKLFNYGLC